MLLKLLILSIFASECIRSTSADQTWTLSTDSKIRSDHELLKNISDLTYKNLLLEANASTTHLVEVMADIGELERTIAKLKQSIKNESEENVKNGPDCSKELGSETCLTCSRRICNQKIGPECGDKVYIPSLRQTSDEFNFETSLEEERQKLEIIEEEMIDKLSAIGVLKKSFANMTSVFENFAKQLPEILILDAVDSNSDDWTQSKIEDKYLGPDPILYVEKELEKLSNLSNKLTNKINQQKTVGSDISSSNHNIVPESFHEKHDGLLAHKTERNRRMAKKPDICADYANRGVHSFCKQFETSHECSELCRFESLCKDEKKISGKIRQLRVMLNRTYQDREEKSAATLRDHGWVKLFHETVRKIDVRLIEIDPSKFELEKPWLFKAVFVEFIVQQKDSTPQHYKLKGVNRANLETASNLMNVYWRSSTIPLAEIVIKELNTTFHNSRDMLQRQFKDSFIIVRAMIFPKPSHRSWN